MNAKRNILTGLLGCGLLFFIACGGSGDDSSEATDSTEATEAVGSEEELAAGFKVYNTYCVLCHGADGKLMLNGALDLSVSILTLPERIEQITNGKNTMVPYKDVLTKEEIESVAKYTMTLTGK